MLSLLLLITCSSLFSLLTLGCTLYEGNHVLSPTVNTCDTPVFYTIEYLSPQVTYPLEQFSRNLIYLQRCSCPSILLQFEYDTNISSNTLVYLSPLKLHVEMSLEQSADMVFLTRPIYNLPLEQSVEPFLEWVALEQGEDMVSWTRPMYKLHLEHSEKPFLKWVALEQGTKLSLEQGSDMVSWTRPMYIMLPLEKSAELFPEWVALEWGTGTISLVRIVCQYLEQSTKAKSPEWGLYKSTPERELWLVLKQIYKKSLIYLLKWSRVLCDMIHNVLCAIQVHWPPVPCPIRWEVIYCCFLTLYSSRLKCRLIRILAVRSYIRQHDFKAFLLSALYIPKFTALMLIAMLLVVPYELITGVGQKYFFNDRCIITSNTIGYIGGGRIPTFTFEQLQPFVNPVYSDSYKPTDIFRFVAHQHLNVVDALYKDEMHVYRNIPLKVFMPELTVKNIQYIAKAHNIYLMYRS